MTQINAGHNGLSELISSKISEGFSTITDAQPFDLILANILAQPLIDLAPDMARFTTPGGHVILSGLLGTQRTSVLSAYTARGFALWQEIADTSGVDTWVTLGLTLQAPPPSSTF